MTSPKSSNIPLGLRIIGGFKLCISMLLALASLGTFRMLHQDIGAVFENYVIRLRLDPENHLINAILARIADIDQKHLKAISAGTLFYALLYCIEGIGLLLGKHWAEYLVIIVTGSLLPLEIYELAEKLTLIRLGVLLLNLVIVAYLIRQIRSDARKQHH